ncbi:MAG: DUF1501 domain-containing protein [Pirellulales bacterium]
MRRKQRDSQLNTTSPVAELSRRDLLAGLGCGFGTLVLGAMLNQDAQAHASLDDSKASDQTAASGRAFDFKPKAKRVIQLFMAGAASHIDLFDFKPDLIKHHGKPADFGEPIEAFQDGLGPWKKPVWEFNQFGKCGKHLSEVVADLGKCVDDMAFIHNMVGKSGVHSTATLLQTTGFSLPGFPGMGCWVSYGLGSDSENLPTFVVLPDHRGFASMGLRIGMLLSCPHNTLEQSSSRIAMCLSKICFLIRPELT